MQSPSGATPITDSERQPLLLSKSTSSSLPVASDEVTLVADAEDDTRDASAPVDPYTPDANVMVEEAPKERSWWIVGVWTVIGLIGVIFLALVIRDIIKSGDVEFDLGRALKSALGGGLSGAAAMVLQVLTLMPLRTTMNYQYRYGTGTLHAIHTLNAAGGLRRFYAGLLPALIQGPLARFGDTAANAGILALFQSNPRMRAWPALLKTAFASVAAALFRIVLTPVDTLKTTMQTQGRAAGRILKNRIKTYGIGTLWYGALATAAATFVGHYPWFGTYNYLDATLPPPPTLPLKLLRQALIGFLASVASDTLSNSLRVVKTYRQVSPVRVGYLEAARRAVREDGGIMRGLFLRGLGTRLLANGLQGLLFSVLWRLFMDIWDDKTK